MHRKNVQINLCQHSSRQSRGSRYKHRQNKEMPPRFHDSIAFPLFKQSRHATRRIARPETSALWRESSKPALRWIDTAPRGSVMGVADS
ncbi:unnamed protein product [Lasius platythorax]|uniref:Uncharacterized protein n=1 Tax=Lasius platythorax TaxID=488582 RepID=A0AAV2N2Z6_9HYME